MYLRGSAGIAMPADARLEPYLTLAYSQLDREHFSEYGADSLNLTVSAETTDSLLSVLGVRAVWDRQWQDGRLQPELRVGWAHQYLDDHGEMTASLAGASITAGYEPFTLRGVTTERDRLLAGAGLVVDIEKNSRLFLNYDLTYASDCTEQAVVAGVRVVW
jgi:outer membrane autotransporter protein